MSKYTFEDFLMEMHAEDYIGTDDNMVDDFAKWVQDLEVDDFFNYGDKFAKKQSQDLLEACKEAKEWLECDYQAYKRERQYLIAKDYIKPLLDNLKQAIKKAEGN